MMPSSLFCTNCRATNQPQAAYCRSCGVSLQAAKPTLYNSATGRLLANVTLKQRYCIIKPAGKGGMGAVYKAEDIQLGNRQVALKEMSQSSLSPQEQKAASDAFRQEALLLAHLQHPNLPTIFDHFEENGRWYLVMSFIEGETLEAYLSHAQGGKLPLEEVLAIGTQLCTVLGYLHNQQPPIIFRDLKPANSMRTPDGHIYLIDFGIARHFKPGQAKDTAYYGSMGYAPPEQFGWAQTTPRSDIYSLGVTLYHLLSGHDPASSPFRFPLLPSLVPTVPTDLARLITQMLELNEEKRPASMLLVKQELQAFAYPAMQKPVLLTSPPTPTSLAPTQVAKANPGPVVAVPTQSASSLAPPTPIQPATKSVSVWAFGKRQLVTTVILAVCYSIVSYIVVSLIFTQPFNETSLDLELSFVLFLPIFFASFFGPWVGIGATGVGFFLADFAGWLRLRSLFDYFPWWLGPLMMLIAFFAGLFLLKTKGQYSKFGNVLFVTLLGLLEICVALVVFDIIDIIVYKNNDLNYFFTDLWALNIPALLLLPLLIFIAHSVRTSWKRRVIRTHP